MTAKHRPDLAHSASEMAVNAARVCRSADMLSGRIDEMVAAVSQEQWREVQELSRQLAQSSRSLGFRAISALAQRVCDEAEKPHNKLGIKRSLLRLIGVHGRSGSRRAETV
jgi:succinylarginine dihydrolase